jgi:hypothetical protein
MTATAIKHRIRKIIREHYDEVGVGEILNIAVVPVVQSVDGEADIHDVYVVQLVVAYASDDDYTIHTETVRVDDNGMSGLTFTLLSETDTQMKDAL